MNTLEALLSAVETARAAALQADAGVARVIPVLDELRAELAGHQEQVRLAIEMSGQALLAARLDGTKATTRPDSRVVSALADGSRLESAVMAAEQRLVRAMEDAEAARAGVETAIDAVCEAEADFAQAELLRVWPSYRDAWLRHAAAAHAAGRYTSQHAEMLIAPDGTRTEVQPVSVHVAKPQVDAAWQGLVGLQLREGR